MRGGTSTKNTDSEEYSVSLQSIPQPAPALIAADRKRNYFSTLQRNQTVSDIKKWKAFSEKVRNVQDDAGNPLHPNSVNNHMNNMEGANRRNAALSMSTRNRQRNNNFKGRLLPVHR